MNLSKAWNNLVYGKQDGKIIRPQRLEISALQQAGIVQVGSNNQYSEPRTLEVGDSVAWVWGDLEVKVKRVSDRQTDDKIVPFTQFKWLMRKRGEIHLDG